MKNTKPIIMLLKGLFLGIILFFSCDEKKTPYQSFQSEINENPNNIEYKNKSANNLSIQIPNSIDDRIQNYLQDFIEKDLETEYCSNEESNIEINYEVTFSTEIFFSIKKETKTMFCYPYDNIYKGFINVLLFKNQLYKINIKDSNHIKQEINNYLETEDVDRECEYEQGEYQLNLNFEKNEAYIYLIKDKVCFLKIPIEIREDNFEFEVLQ